MKNQPKNELLIQELNDLIDDNILLLRKLKNSNDKKLKIKHQKNELIIKNKLRDLIHFEILSLKENDSNSEDILNLIVFLQSLDPTYFNEKIEKDFYCKKCGKIYCKCKIANKFLDLDNHHLDHHNHHLYHNNHHSDHHNHNSQHHNHHSDHHNHNSQHHNHNSQHHNHHSQYHSHHLDNHHLDHHHHNNNNSCHHLDHHHHHNNNSCHHLDHHLDNHHLDNHHSQYHSHHLDHHHLDHHHLDNHHGYNSNHLDHHNHHFKDYIENKNYIQEKMNNCNRNIEKEDLKEFDKILKIEHGNYISNCEQCNYTPKNCPVEEIYFNKFFNNFKSHFDICHNCGKKFDLCVCYLNNECKCFDCMYVLFCYFDWNYLCINNDTCKCYKCYHKNKLQVYKEKQSIYYDDEFSCQKSKRVVVDENELLEWLKSRDNEWIKFNNEANKLKDIIKNLGNDYKKKIFLQEYYNQKYNEISYKTNSFINRVLYKYKSKFDIYILKRECVNSKERDITLSLINFIKKKAF